MTKAIIIGAGIGGLTCGIALKQRGWQVEIFERTPEIREVGAGLTIWTNAVKILWKLGLAEQLQAESAWMQQSEIRNWKGQLIVRTDLQLLASKLGAPTVGIHRASLQKMLAEAFGREQVHLGFECSGYDQTPDRVIARFTNGQQAEADLLIGADGIRSAVRKQLLGDQPLRYSGYSAWRGLAPYDPSPVSPGTTIFLTGRGAQVGILPISKQLLYWFATVNTPAGQSDPVEGPKPRLQELFGNWHATVGEVIQATPITAIIRNDIYDRVPVKKWSKGRVTILGDAAHPTTPNMGQGACQAIESAWVLARKLNEMPDIPVALQAYELARFERTAQITNQSWSMGKLFAWESRFLCWTRDVLMKFFSKQLQAEIERIVGVEV